MLEMNYPNMEECLQNVNLAELGRESDQQIVLSLRVLADQVVSSDGGIDESVSDEFEVVVDQ
jgi:hypothetical protein